MRGNRGATDVQNLGALEGGFWHALHNQMGVRELYRAAVKVKLGTAAVRRALQELDKECVVMIRDDAVHCIGERG